MWLDSICARRSVSCRDSNWAQLAANRTYITCHSMTFGVLFRPVGFDDAKSVHTSAPTNVCQQGGSAVSSASFRYNSMPHWVNIKPTQWVTTTCHMPVACSNATCSHPISTRKHTCRVCRQVKHNTALGLPNSPLQYRAVAEGHALAKLQFASGRV